MCLLYNFISHLFFNLCYNVIVQKECVKVEERDGETIEETIVEKLTGVDVKLTDRKLIVDIPDKIEVLSTDVICVDSFDDEGNIIQCSRYNYLTRDLTNIMVISLEDFLNKFNLKL